MFIDIYNTKNTYNLILADPPWRQSKGGRKSVRPNSSGGDLEYQTMTLEDIREVLATADSLVERNEHNECNEHSEHNKHSKHDTNSILFLWTIDKYLFEAQELAESLGYKLHARMIWNKVTGIPAAFTVRYGHEYLLYMYKGKLTPVAKDARGKIHTVFTEQVKRHSQKPIISYEIIENLYPNQRKLELFARYPREQWDCWGNDPNLMGVK